MRRHPVDAVMLEQRAASFTRRSIKTSAKREALRVVVSMLDLTTLEGKDSPEKVRSLCRKAISPYERPIDPPIPSVAAICVYPALVSEARKALADPPWPSPRWPPAFRAASIRWRCASRTCGSRSPTAPTRSTWSSTGAHFLAGRFEQVAEEIRQTRIACGEAHLKIILETGELGTYDAIREASDLAIEAAESAGPVRDGEVFIKTSTGKVSPAATMPTTLVMLEAIRDHHRATGVRIGMKPAGGIRTAKQALHYLVMVKETLGPEWLAPRLFRFGASSLLNDVLRQILKQETGHYMAAFDFSEG